MTQRYSFLTNYCLAAMRPIRRAASYGFPRFYSVVALLSLACVSASFAQLTVLGSAVYSGNGKAYVLLSNSNWTNAQAKAVLLGGTLVCIDNAAEAAFVFSTFNNFGKSRKNLWIGLRDFNESVNSIDRNVRRTEFTWVNGQTTSYSNWSPVEPLNPRSGEPTTWEYYVHIWQANDFYGGRWNNYTNGTSVFSVPLHGVVETCAYIPEVESGSRCLGGDWSATATPVGTGPFNYN